VANAASNRFETAYTIPEAMASTSADVRPPTTEAKSGVHVASSTGNVVPRNRPPALPEYLVPAVHRYAYHAAETTTEAKKKKEGSAQARSAAPKHAVGSAGTEDTAPTAALATARPYEEALASAKADASLVAIEAKIAAAKDANRKAEAATMEHRTAAQPEMLVPAARHPIPAVETSPKTHDMTEARQLPCTWRRIMLCLITCLACCG